MNILENPTFFSTRKFYIRLNQLFKMFHSFTFSDKSRKPQFTIQYVGHTV